ncbi:MAG: glutamine-hydrolyzing carbamoyl-phosphate synthase small subunit [Bacteroidota bacterium]
MSQPKPKPATLLLQDGTSFQGYSIGKAGTSGGEICFNTGMTGYQEIYTDPSYFGQIIVNTSAHIGNYGTLPSENESSRTTISGLVLNEFSHVYSRQKSQQSLQTFLEKHETVGIAGLDTRKLVRHIRTKGAMNAIISTELVEKDLSQKLAELPDMDALELSSKVSTKEVYDLSSQNTGFKIAVLDLGIKQSIMDNLTDRNCSLRVFPATTTFSEMSEWQADGYFISNGPGDPQATGYAVETCKEILQNDLPIFGICMGSQILAMAAGISTYKMHHGHRGLNHPVKNLSSGLSEITSQNHGFAVSMDELKKSKEAELTHLDLNDNTVEGLRLNGKPAFAVQYHPESSPGPNDSTYLFDEFIDLITKNK